MIFGLKIVVFVCMLTTVNCAGIRRVNEIGKYASNISGNAETDEYVTGIPRTSSAVDVVHPKTGFNVVVCPMVKNETHFGNGLNCPRGFANPPACDQPDLSNINKCRWRSKYLKKSAGRGYSGINCNQRFLTCLGNTVVFPHTTSVLDLSKNNLFDATEITEVLAHLPNLLFIDISGNSFQKLHPHMFSRNEDLKVVYANLNFLTYIPEELFARNGMLEKVTFSGNRIDYIPPRLFANNINLKSVAIERNEIEIVPSEMFYNNPRLIEVTLTWNKIEVIPQGLFRNNRKLQKITLAENFISNLPEEIFKQTTDVREINLSYNKLKHLPTTLLHNCRELRHLRLDRNSLSFLPDNFLIKNKKLQTLDIGFNRIMTLNAYVTRRNPFLTILNDHTEGGYWKGQSHIYEDKKFFSADILNSSKDEHEDILTITVQPKKAKSSKTRPKKPKKKNNKKPNIQIRLGR